MTTYEPTMIDEKAHIKETTDGVETLHRIYFICAGSGLVAYESDDKVFFKDVETGEFKSVPLNKGVR